MTPASTHCQICARAIRAKTGLVAHHGYRRPWQQGYQTGSCYGARRLPYEISCDAIDEYVVLLSRTLKDRREALQKFRVDPPAELTYQRHDAYGRPQGSARSYPRPEGFDGTKKQASADRHSYGGLHTSSVWERERIIRDIDGDLAVLLQRRRDWVDPAAGSEAGSPK